MEVHKALQSHQLQLLHIPNALSPSFQPAQKVPNETDSVGLGYGMGVSPGSTCGDLIPIVRCWQSRYLICLRLQDVGPLLRGLN